MSLDAWFFLLIGIAVSIIRVTAANAHDLNVPAIWAFNAFFYSASLSDLLAIRWIDRKKAWRDPAWALHGKIPD